MEQGRYLEADAGFDERLPQRPGIWPARRDYPASTDADAGTGAGKGGDSARAEDLAEQVRVCVEEHARGWVGAEKPHVEQRRATIAQQRRGQRSLQLPTGPEQ